MTDPDYMNAAEYERALAALGLTAYSAAPVLGISLRASMRYQAGEKIPAPLAKLLRLAVKTKASADTLRSPPPVR
jgi:hypothetical protein